MAELNFNFNKPYDEIDVNGKIYKLYFDDESLRKYRDQANKYSKKSKEHLNKIQKDMTLEQEAKAEKEGLSFLKEFIEIFYGEGSYTEFYEASGKSMLNLMPLVEYTLSWLQKKTPDVDQKKKEYYTKKRKK